jgi:serine/threonine protein kinase
MSVLCLSLHILTSEGLTVMSVACVLHQNLIMQKVDHSAGALIDLLQRLLKFDPSERISAKDALKHDFLRERT